MVEYSMTPVPVRIESRSKKKRPLAVIKFLELCLSAACTILHFYSFDNYDLVTGFLATGTFCGFNIILFGAMAGEFDFSLIVEKKLLSEFRYGFFLRIFNEGT